MKTYYLRLDAQKRAVARFPYGTNLSRLQSMSDYLGASRYSYYTIEYVDFFFDTEEEMTRAMMLL